MNERMEQIKAVMADEAFVKSCIEAENEEAVQKLFAGKGIEMSLTEIEVMKEMIGGVAEGELTLEDIEKITQSGELSEEELAEAAGGFGPWYNLEDKSAAFIKMLCTKIGDAGGKDLYSLSALKIGGYVVAGLAAAGAIAQACGVDVVGGIKTGYNWCKDKITSRW